MSTETSISSRKSLVQRIGDYNIASKIPDQEVYFGYHKDNKNKLAFIKGHRPNEPTIYLENEAKLMRLAGKHPHVSQLISEVYNGTLTHIVIEHIPGTDLYSHSRVTQPTLYELVRLTCDALKGLDALHSKGIVHRDIKPENIMVTPQGIRHPHGTLIDLGAAIHTDEQNPALLDGVPCTDEYAAPEFFDPRMPIINRKESDIFEFGVLLCKYLMHAHPYAKKPRYDYGATLIDPNKRKIKRDRLCFAWDELGEVIDKAIQQDLSKRHEDAHKLLSDITESIRVSKIDNKLRTTTYHMPLNNR